MADLFREAPVGQVVRFMSGNRFFQYPEERKDFRCPQYYRANASLPATATIVGHSSDSQVTDISAPKSSMVSKPKPNADLEETAVSSSASEEDSNDQKPAVAVELHRTRTTTYTNERLDFEDGLELEPTKSRPIIPAKTADGIILVEWYDLNDPANPQNWSQTKKAFVAFQIL